MEQEIFQKYQKMYPHYREEISLVQYQYLQKLKIEIH